MVAHNPRNRPFSRRDLCLWLAVCTSGAARRALAQPDPTQADELLANGDAAKALELYESLVRQGESLDAELGLIRAALRAGEFRKAAANANLSAGEHPESVEAAALLAYLDDRCARTERALAALRGLQQARPDEWLPIAAQAEVLIDRLVPGQAIASIQTWLAQHAPAGGAGPAELARLLARARAAAGDPSLADTTNRERSWVAAGFESLPPVDASIATAGNGVVVDGGRVVLTYGGLLGSAKRIWVRNGVGHVRAAAVEPPRPADGLLVRLRLDAPYPAGWSIAPQQVAVPEGVRFCFVFAFGAPHSRDAAYPCITSGVMVHADTGVGGLMQFSGQLGRGHNGAPLFDARGQLLGVSLASGEHTIAGNDVRKALGAGALALRVDGALRESAAATPVISPIQPAPPMPPVEELYERLAPAIVQVVAAA